MLATRPKISKGRVFMFKAAVVLISVLVPSSARSVDLTLGVDNRLAVVVPKGVAVVFWDREGKRTEVTESGRVSIRPGSYSVQAGEQFTICRVWAHGTAPPAAIPIVRGQSVQSHFSNLGKWRWIQRTMVVTGIGLVVWGVASAS